MAEARAIKYGPLWDASVAIQQNPLLDFFAGGVANLGRKISEPGHPGVLDYALAALDVPITAGMGAIAKKMLNKANSLYGTHISNKLFDKFDDAAIHSREGGGYGGEVDEIPGHYFSTTKEVDDFYQNEVFGTTGDYTSVDIDGMDGLFEAGEDYFRNVDEYSELNQAFWPKVFQHGGNIDQIKKNLDDVDIDGIENFYEGLRGKKMTLENAPDSLYRYHVSVPPNKAIQYERGYKEPYYEYGDNFVVPKGKDINITGVEEIPILKEILFQ